MDLDIYFDELLTICKKKNFLIRHIGEVFLDPIYLITPELFDHRLPTLLIAAGFHGEECGGPLGLLEFLKSDINNLLSKVNLSFLPVVNPSGLRLDRRTNIYHERTNNGFIHCDISLLSQEGKILTKWLELLLTYSKNGFLSLHEDVLSSNAYVYTFEDLEIPGPFSTSFVDILKQYYPILPNGISLRGDEERGICHNGIIFNFHDSTFEDLLFHK